MTKEQALRILSELPTRDQWTLADAIERAEVVGDWEHEGLDADWVADTKWTLDRLIDGIMNPDAMQGYASIYREALVVVIKTTAAGVTIEDTLRHTADELRSLIDYV